MSNINHYWIGKEQRKAKAIKHTTEMKKQYSNEIEKQKQLRACMMLILHTIMH